MESASGTQVDLSETAPEQFAIHEDVTGMHVREQTAVAVVSIDVEFQPHS